MGPAHAERAGTQAVIVGAGPAGDAVAAGLRDGGWEGEIVLIGAEPERPYERPHLSKGYLAGTVPRDRLWLRPAPQYVELRVELVLGDRVVDLGLDRREVALASGRTVRWDRLCIAMGSDARRLDGHGDAIYLRELPAADQLRTLLDRRDPLTILGAGFIGCEVAAVAVTKGCEVRVHEALEQPMVRVLGPELGGFFAEVHRAHGVRMHLNAQKPPRVDLVAIGSIPRTDVVVDEFGRAPGENVFGAGDVAHFYHPLFERHIRVEHFQTSQRQGFATGRAMAGAGQVYAEVPWFWSEQYDLNLQYAGAGLPWDEIAVRGELGRPPFTVFYLRGGELVGAAGVNDHHTVARARRVMEERKPVTKLALEDATFDLRRVLD